MRIRRQLLAVAAALCAHGAWAQAAEPAQPPVEPAPAAAPVAGPGFSFNGFGSFGVVSTNTDQSWTFQRDVLQPSVHQSLRADVDTRVGVQGNLRFNPRWEAVGQLVARKSVNHDLAQQSVEWLFLAYKPAPDWAIRVGRTDFDVFLLAEYRNVGYAYPWVRPNMEFYGWMPVRSVDGIDVTKTWAGEDATWRAKLNVGRSEIPVDGGGDPRLKVSGIYGLSVSREANGLTLKASAAGLRSSLRVPDLATSALAGVQAVAGSGIPVVSTQAQSLLAQSSYDNMTGHYLAFGLQYERGPWQLHAEVSRVTGSLASTNGRFAYVSVGRRFGDVTLFAMTGKATPDKPAVVSPQWTAALTPFVGPVLAAQAQAVADEVTKGANSHRTDQRSLSLGLRWDFHPRAALKVQFDRYLVGPSGAGLWNDNNASPGQANVATAVLDFIF